MVGEQGVSVYKVQFALTGMRESPLQRVRLACGIQAKQVIKPSLHWVVQAVSDWLLESHFRERARVAHRSSSFLVLNTDLVLLSQRVEKLQAQTAAGSFVAMDCGTQNHHVGSEDVLHQRDWDRSSLINYHEFRLRQLGVILGLDVLNRLSMVSEDVDTHDSVVELRVGALKNFVVSVLFVVKRVEAPKQEFKHSLQVFRGRGSHEDIAEAVNDTRGNSDAQTGRFTATTACSETNGCFERLLRYFVDQLHH